MPSCLGFICIKITSLLNKLKALLFSVLKKVHMFLSTYFLNTDSKCMTVSTFMESSVRQRTEYDIKNRRDNSLLNFMAENTTECQM